MNRIISTSFLGVLGTLVLPIFRRCLRDLKLEGDWDASASMRLLYATDASVYREVPAAVVFPKSARDVQKLVCFAAKKRLSIMPRGAGTSLAGQVVGNGVVLDFSRHMNRILEFNEAGQWVAVEPGVVRHDLNVFLAQKGFFFAPETSTANRATIGGMFGNNACGANTLAHGTTREHIISVEAVLSDGSMAAFGSLTCEAFDIIASRQDGSLESAIYRGINEMLSPPEARRAIANSFPNPALRRRNTGYALDILAEMSPFSLGGEDFNFCKLLAGSEGTLALATKLKLRILPLPRHAVGTLCGHFNSVAEALEANTVALRHAPTASELVDRPILEAARLQREQARNRAFVEGDPAAILAVELVAEDTGSLRLAAGRLRDEWKRRGLGYAAVFLEGSEAGKINSLRKAGLGLLSNTPGRAKPVAVIEDMAVMPEDLPSFIREADAALDKLGLASIHYGHAGSGQLHLRPLLDLKNSADRLRFREVSEVMADLVKRFHGSLSGEHGDGRLRGEGVARVLGAGNIARFETLKQTWDPHGIFNPGKIIRTPPMNTFLRQETTASTQVPPTPFDFGDDGGLLGAVERCNGSADCRKTAVSGGLMCPTYMATLDEKQTPRARANILREWLSGSGSETGADACSVREIMGGCLSCKGCKSECPSNVDIAKLKAAALYLSHRHHLPLPRDIIAAHHATLMAYLAPFPGLYNFLSSSSFFKRVLGWHPKRSLPPLSPAPAMAFLGVGGILTSPPNLRGKVYFFRDEFTFFHDAIIGMKTVALLSSLGYELEIPRHVESGRACISKGFLDKARRLAIENVTALAPIISEKTPLVGLEPSAILTFRDEYPDLVPPSLRATAISLAKNCLLLDEFLAREKMRGSIDASLFTDERRYILLHGHCHQKALASMSDTVSALTIPQNYSVETISAGCCGMAGAFGLEKEHAEISMKIGEQFLFPKIRQELKTTIVAATGTSCRKQIKYGTGRNALHPVEILWDALRNNYGQD